MGSCGTSAAREGVAESETSRQESLLDGQSDSVLGKRGHELGSLPASASMQAPPAPTQKVATMDCASTHGQVVRDSLGLVQAMRAARSAEKAHQEQFVGAQKALQV